VGSLDRRVEALERLYASSAGEPADKAKEAEREILAAILDEIGYLGACRANSHYRGGTPPTPIQPTDPTGDALGYPYTHGEETEFAVRWAVERLGFVGREAEELITTWVAGLRSLDRDRWGRWDEVAAEGPPEPTPPWR
jgi:hypothetical protein